MTNDEHSSLSFEAGPIRPPNEAYSLLVRVTRNCPYNRCAFCPVYKDAKFSLRSVAEVCDDIAAMAATADRIRDQLSGQPMTEPAAHALLRTLGYGAAQVVQFLATGGRTAFLQDANSLIMPVDQLLEVLRCLRQSFPSLRRVTTYARAHTVCKRTVDELSRLREAGLDRVHIGLESGSDRVLKLIDKGVTAERHIEAGKRIKQAGLSLSEYVMPGLGGKALSTEHAEQTARVLREIDPHFVRLRTVTVPPGSPLAALVESGDFEPLGDEEIVGELRTLLAGFDGMTSTVRSDHVLNLLEDISGKLPDDLPRMRALVDRFLAMPPAERDAFVVGRRLGVVRRLDDMDEPHLHRRAELALERLRRRFPGPLDDAIRELMTRFV